MKLIIASHVLASVLTAHAFSQGNDCASATLTSTSMQRWSWQAVPGALTTSNFAAGTPCALGANMVDQFFQWTAPADGDYVFDTSFNYNPTGLSISRGVGCAATCVARDLSAFDGCVITLTGVLAGEEFLICSGSEGLPYPFNNGSLSITRLNPLCDASTDDSLEPNDVYYRPRPMEDGTYSDLLLTRDNQDFYSFCVAPGATLQVDLDFVHIDGDIDIEFRVTDPTLIQGATFAAVADGELDGETLSWTNTTSENKTIRAEVRFAGFSEFAAMCNRYSMTVSGAGNCSVMQTGTFCDPMEVNSTGLATALTVTADLNSPTGLNLMVSQGPPNQFGFFVTGRSIQSPGVPLGNGRLCLGGSPYPVIYRYSLQGTTMNSVGRFDPNGNLVNLSGTSSTGFGFDVPYDLPIGFFQIYTGQTFHFQFWHRDQLGGSNLSNGVSVLF